MRALCLAESGVKCASLKSNMGHLEAAAAAAGLASLIAGPLLAAVVVVNAQLRASERISSRAPRLSRRDALLQTPYRLNAHLSLFL